MGRKAYLIYENRRTSLIRERERRGVSRAELADTLKVSREYVYRIEMGIRSPSLAVMMRWADALNATMDIFRDAEDDSHARSAA